MKSSAIAGTLAACGGLLGKLGADSDTAIVHRIQQECMALALFSSPEATCAAAGVAVRAGFLGLMLATNALMLTFFVKGLHETDSLTATVTSAAVNFVLSATGGMVLFGEHLPPQWFVGAIVILFGVGLLLYGDYDPEKDKAE